MLVLATLYEGGAGCFGDRNKGELSINLECKPKGKTCWGKHVSVWAITWDEGLNCSTERTREMSTQRHCAPHTHPHPHTPQMRAYLKKTNAAHLIISQYTNSHSRASAQHFWIYLKIKAFFVSQNIFFAMNLHRRTLPCHRDTVLLYIMKHDWFVSPYTDCTFHIVV